MKVCFVPYVIRKLLFFFSFCSRWSIMAVTVLDSAEKMGQAEMEVPLFLGLVAASHLEHVNVQSFKNWSYSPKYWLHIWLIRNDAD